MDRGHRADREASIRNRDEQPSRLPVIILRFFPCRTAWSGFCRVIRGVPRSAPPLVRPASQLMKVLARVYRFAMPQPHSPQFAALCDAQFAFPAAYGGDREYPNPNFYHTR